MPRRYWIDTSTTPCSTIGDEITSAPAPAQLAPPWIHTITGSLASGVKFGVRTLRVRQSSLPASASLWFQVRSGCRQEAPKRVASRGSLQRATGAGGFQRSSPSGGAAKGMPRKTAPRPIASPRTGPSAVSATGPCAHPSSGNARRTAATRRRIKSTRLPHRPVIFGNGADDVIEGTGRRRLLDETAIGIENIAPQAGYRHFEEFVETLHGLYRQIPMLLLAGQFGGQAMGLDPLGLRPEARLLVMRGEIVVQAEEGDATIVGAEGLADLDQAQGRLDHLVVAAHGAPAHQQPGPFELVARLDDAALLARHRLPIAVEEFTQGTRLAVDQIGQGQPGDLVGNVAPRPFGVGLGPSLAAFEQMHMRVRAERHDARYRLLETDDRMLAGLAPFRHQLARHVDIGAVMAEHLIGAVQTEQGEGLVVEGDGLVERLAVRRHQGAEQPVGAAVIGEVEIDAVTHRALGIAGPAERFRLAEGIDLARLHAGALGQHDGRAVLRQLFVKPALLVIRALFPPDRIGLVGRPFFQAGQGLADGGHGTSQAEWARICCSEDHNRAAPRTPDESPHWAGTILASQVSEKTKGRTAPGKRSNSSGTLDRPPPTTKASGSTRLQTTAMARPRRPIRRSNAATAAGSPRRAAWTMASPVIWRPPSDSA